MAWYYFGIFYIHNTCLHIYMYFWVDPYPIKRGCLWRVEWGLGSGHGSPEPAALRDAWDCNKCLNESMNGSQNLGEIFSLCCVPSWTICIFFLLCLYNCFSSKTKVCKNMLFSFAILSLCLSVSSASKVSFPFSLSSTIFRGGSDQRLPLCGHPSFFWIRGSFTFFIPRECRILLRSVPSFLLVYWERALWSGMVWLIWLPPKATKSLSW